MNGNAILFSSERYGMRNHASWGSLEDVMIAFVNREAFDKYKMSKKNLNFYRCRKRGQKAEEDKNKDKEKVDEKPQDIVMEFENMDQRIVRLTPNSSRLGSFIIDKEEQNSITCRPWRVTTIYGFTICVTFY